MINTILVTAMFAHSGLHLDQLVVKDDVIGTGPIAKAGDIVSVDYTGTLPNGTQFDSSIGRAPFLFMIGAGQVIKGWEDGVLGMHEGGKRELTIPPALGYGDKAVAKIPANSVLHFTISLLKVEPKVQITVLTPGTGTVQTEVGDIAHLYFSGGVKGGKILFDSRDRSKDPINILVGERTLPIGFVPSLLGMKEGEKRRVDIPSPLAYGAKGVPAVDTKGVKAGSVIAPNSDLEFTFELVKIEKPVGK